MFILDVLWQNELNCRKRKKCSWRTHVVLAEINGVWLKKYKAQYFRCSNVWDEWKKYGEVKDLNSQMGFIGIKWNEKL